MTEAVHFAAERTGQASGMPASGIVWVYHFRDDGTAEVLPCEQVDAALARPDGWTWIHIGLADARARAWIAQHEPVSEAAREVLSAADEHMRLDLNGNELVGVLPDLHQAFAQPDDELVRLRFAMTERMLITARRSPVHALELARRSIETGRRFRAPIAFLDAVIDQFADAIGRLSETIGEQLDAIENHLLTDELGDERQRLGRIRLQLVRMHRHLSQLCMVFHRIEPRAASESKAVARAVRTLVQKLEAIDHDTAAQHERARLLVDEVAGRMAAITNRRLHTISVLTACLLPPTLVTGMFGMNTKHLPFQETDGGTWFALAIAAGAAAVAYWLMRRLRAF
jgi:zinc transporter